MLYPLYPSLPGAARFRRLASARELTQAERCAYGETVLDGIRALQRSELARETPSNRPRCASGTAHTDGVDILAAIRRSQALFCEAAARASRKARSDADLRKAYDEAMAAKRKALADAAEATRAVLAPIRALRPQKPAPAPVERPCAPRPRAITSIMGAVGVTVIL